MTSAATIEEPLVTAPARTVVETTGPRRFTNVDRCDSCGAQAFIGATVNGTELLFCAHHARKYKTNLYKVATAWHDESDILSEENRLQGEP